MPAKCPPKHFQNNSQCQFTVSCGVVFEAILTLVTLEMKAQFETKSISSTLPFKSLGSERFLKNTFIQDCIKLFKSDSKDFYFVTKIVYFKSILLF